MSTGPDDVSVAAVDGQVTLNRMCTPRTLFASAAQPPSGTVVTPLPPDDELPLDEELPPDDELPLDEELPPDDELPPLPLPELPVLPELEPPLLLLGPTTPLPLVPPLLQPTVTAIAASVAPRWRTTSGDQRRNLIVHSPLRLRTNDDCAAPLRPGSFRHAPYVTTRRVPIRSRLV